MALADNMMLLRRMKNRSQAELGKMIGTSGDVIGRYERGDITPSIKAVAKIADALEVSVDSLIGKTKMKLDKDTLRRVEDISLFSKENKSFVLNLIDMALRDFKTKWLTPINKDLVPRQYILSIPILAMILSNGIVHGQLKNSIQIILAPKEGEVRKYHITSTSESFIEKGSYKALNSTEKDVLIKITGVNKDKINIEWIYDKITFTNSALQFDPILGLMNSLNKDMTIRYAVNSHGTITSISNYNEITLKVKQQVDGMIQQMSQDNTDPSLVEALKFQLEMILSSQELLDALVLEDVYKFHELYGVSFQKESKNLIPEKNMPDDSYAVEWMISSSNNRHKLSGELVSSFTDKKGQKIYEFELPTYWLEYYSSKWYATIPISVSNSYTITLSSPQ